MVNNAGLGVEGVMVHEMEEEMWDRTMLVVNLSRTFASHHLSITSSRRFTNIVVSRTVNLRSVYLGCKYACAQFLRQDLGPSGHRGWIVNTSSILGAVGLRDGARKASLFFSIWIMQVNPIERD